ncbi:MAG: hypothetical protein ACFFBV_01820 [Promethearchaeota archaeon]
MGAGKSITLVGAIIAVVTLLLSFIVPQYFGWYRIEGTVLGITGGVYFTGLGTLASVPAGGPTGFDYLQLIGGIALIVGVVACIIGAVKEMKAAGIVGGILILVSPLILIIDLAISASGFAALIMSLGGPPGASVFWGSFLIVGPPDVLLSWGIWIGTFLSLGGGVLGIIGGATL